VTVTRKPEKDEGNKLHSNTSTNHNQELSDDHRREEKSSPGRAPR
ncbi:hypothetical protein A2U01_0061140, partial [Trifolium medium]|nr:hypothetical protein [Trifolium medium]